MVDTKDLAIKFWKKAEKTVGKYDEFDAAVKTICPEDVKESVRHAFRDLTVRTMKKSNAYQNVVISLDDMASEACKGPFELSSLILQLTGKRLTAEAFDTWHKNTCDQAVEFLKEYYVPEDCSYGKAQKIVNMSLKNLYALCVVKGIEDQYASLFRYCHVPLDSFTLEWFCRECFAHGQPVTKGKILNWSAICKYGDKDTDEYMAADKKQYYTYFYFQKKFREWYSDTITPLRAEFIHWPRIQMELAAENFLFALEDDITTKQKQQIRERSLAEKLNDIRDRLNV